MITMVKKFRKINLKTVLVLYWYLTQEYSKAVWAVVANTKNTELHIQYFWRSSVFFIKCGFWNFAYHMQSLRVSVWDDEHFQYSTF